MAQLKTVSLDFDGVIHRYSKGWQDGTIYDPPITASFEMMRLLMIRHPLVISTVRDIDQVAEWLTEHGGFTCVADNGHRFWNMLGVVLVTNMKIAAHAYVDDRGVRFQSWAQTMNKLMDLGIVDADELGEMITNIVKVLPEDER